MFLALVEQGLIHRRERPDGDWRLRITAYARDSERDLEALDGWDEAALAAQREVLGRVDGRELDATTFDGALLTVFTPHPDAIAQAAFVAVASDHPDAERWRDGRVRHRARRGRRCCRSWSARRWPPASERPRCWEFPARDTADAALAKRLPEPAGTTWRASRTSAVPRPAARWRVRDAAISSQSRVWSWLALCVPPGERSEELPGHPEYARWLPAAQIVRCADAGEETLHQRVLTKALCDTGQLPELPGREPFAGALTHGAVRLGRPRTEHAVRQCAGAGRAAGPRSAPTPCAWRCCTPPPRERRSPGTTSRCATATTSSSRCTATPRGGCRRQAAP